MVAAWGAQAAQVAWPPWFYLALLAVAAGGAALGAWGPGAGAKLAWPWQWGSCAAVGLAGSALAWALGLGPWRLPDVELVAGGQPVRLLPGSYLGLAWAMAWVVGSGCGQLVRRPASPAASSLGPASLAAARQGVLLLTAAMGLWMLLELFRGPALTASLRPEPFGWPWWALGQGGLLLAALALPSGLAGQAREQQWQATPDLACQPGLGRRWLRVACGLAAAAWLGAWPLPAAISPVYRMDWYGIMSSFTDWLAQQWLARFSGGLALPPSPPTAPRLALPAPGVGGAGGPGATSLLAAAAVLAGLALALVQLLRLLASRERRGGPEAVPRRRGGRRWPWLAWWSWPGHLWRWLVGLWRGRRPDEELWLPSAQKAAAGGPLAFRRLRWPHWRRPLRPGTPAAWVRLWFRQLLVQGQRAGLRRPTHQTAQEYAQQLASALPEVAGEVAQVAASYLEARYAGRPLPQGRVALARRAFRAVLGRLRARQLRRLG